ncbi:hypothetical protein BJX64DRAFT_271791 [Aspergillus heterothallicus]
MHYYPPAYRPDIGVVSVCRPSGVVTWPLNPPHPPFTLCSPPVSVIIPPHDVQSPTSSNGPALKNPGEESQKQRSHRTSRTLQSSALQEIHHTLHDLRRGIRDDHGPLAGHVQ